MITFVRPLLGEWPANGQLSPKEWPPTQLPVEPISGGPACALGFRDSRKQRPNKEILISDNLCEWGEKSEVFQWFHLKSTSVPSILTSSLCALIKTSSVSKNPSLHLFSPFMNFFCLTKQISQDVPNPGWHQVLGK